MCVSLVTACVCFSGCVWQRWTSPFANVADVAASAVKVDVPAIVVSVGIEAMVPSLSGSAAAAASLECLALRCCVRFVRWEKAKMQLLFWNETPSWCFSWCRVRLLGNCSCNHTCYNFSEDFHSWLRKPTMEEKERNHPWIHKVNLVWDTWSP